MTRKAAFIALTASILGSLTLSATAEAGGLRLNFGGPMASFVAVPTHGGYSAPSAYGRGAHCAKSRPQTQVASRQHSVPRHSEPKIARAETKPARQEKVQVASVQRETSKPKARVVSTEKAVEKVESTSSANASPVEASGSLALAQTDNAASTAAANAETPAVEPVVVAQTTATPADTTPVAAAQPEVTNDDAAKDVGCKKFIPSVGVTIDVGCKK